MGGGGCRECIEMAIILRKHDKEILMYNYSI